MSKRPDKNLIVGLDIGTSKVVAIVGEINPEGRLEIIGLGSHASKGLKKGVVVNIDSTVQSIQRAIEEVLGLRVTITNSRKNAITSAIESASSSVVGVNITQIRQQRINPFFDPFWDDFFPQKRSYKVESFGSGVIISSDGYIITNQHVIDNASEIIITTSGGSKYEAEIIGSDELTDIALLKIDASSLDPVPVGDSDNLIIGEWAIAIGNPLGLFNVSNQATATAGIISGINMDFGQKRSGRVYQNMIHITMI